MARKPLPGMGDELSGFESLYPGPAQDETIPQDAPEAPEPAPKAKGARKPPGQGKGAGKGAVAPKAKWGEGRLRNTRSFSITDDTYDRIRRYAFAKNVGLSDVAETAFVRALDRAEEANGGPFPPVPQAKETPDLGDL